MRTWFQTLWKNLPIVCGLLLLAAMAINTIGHPSAIGYDIASHWAYARVLTTGHLPRPDQTAEFFTPPLSYVPPVIAMLCGLGNDAAGKVWQIAELGYALVVLIQLRWLARELRLGNLAQIVGLLTLASAAVWWRTYTFTRPEPLITALIFTALRLTTQLFNGQRTTRRFLLAGICWGAACLTRQWGILAALCVLVALPAARNKNFAWWKGTALSALACAIVAGPFYLSLHFRFGSVTAMKQSPVPTQLKWAWHPVYDSTHPFSPALISRPLDILYTDVWGDYWMYFLVNATDRHGRLYYAGRLRGQLESGRPIAVMNVPEMTRHLRFVLLTALPMMLLLIAAVLASAANAARNTVRPRNADTYSAAEPLLTSLVLTSIIGYCLVIGTYTVVTSDTDTTKASYMLQTWPAMATLVALWTHRLGTKWPWLAKAILIFVAAVFVSHAGTFFSRFIGVEVKLPGLNGPSGLPPQLAS